MHTYTVFGHRPDGKAGDGLTFEAASKDEAKELFLEQHPGWVIESVQEA